MSDKSTEIIIITRRRGSDTSVSRRKNRVDKHRPCSGLRSGNRVDVVVVWDARTVGTKDESSAYAQEERGVSPFQCHDRLGQATAKEANKEPERERERGRKTFTTLKSHVKREREVLQIQ
jgi:hypothetical protein